MTNEKCFAAYALLGNVADDMIVDALLPEDRGVGVAPVKKERPRRLFAFFESGWGVAIVCALVAVSVMGGIIWAGNRPGPVTPPAGTVEPESDPMTQEILTDNSEESSAETSEPVTVFVPTETTRSCTGRDMYEWGAGEKWLARPCTVELTCTVAGAILDISKYDFELVNLDTGKQAVVGYVEIEDYVGKNKAYPTAPDAFAQYRRTLLFDRETTPPGRYRLTYTGVELSEGEEYPYYDFEIYEPDVYVLESYGGNHGNVTALDEQIAWGEGDPVIDVVFNIQDCASSLPVVSVIQSAGCQIVGAEIRNWVLYDENFNILYEGREWSDPVEAGVGTFYVEILGYKQGDYIPETDEYKGGLYTYAFCLEVRPYCDGSCAETELPYDVETTPVE